MTDIDNLSVNRVKSEKIKDRKDDSDYYSRLNHNYANKEDIKDNITGIAIEEKNDIRKEKCVKCCCKYDIFRIFNF